MAEKRERHIKTDIMRRVTTLYIFAILLVILIAARIGYVLFFSKEIEINSKRLEQQIYKPATLHAHRGAILARNGEALASSIFRYSIEFDFGAPGFDDREWFISEVDTLAPLLADFFGDRSAGYYKERFIAERDERNPKRSHRGITIFRNVDFNEWEILKTYPLLNSSSILYSRNQHEERVYPLDSMARRTVGLNDDRGHYGLEYAFDEDLRGVDGIEWRQHITYGSWVRTEKPGTSKRLIIDTSGRFPIPRLAERDNPWPDIDNQDPVDGADVITTIDADIQAFAERTLRKRLADEEAIWGTTMVMDVKTGDLLAISNLTRDGKTGFIREDFNYALGRRTEPGSTFKVASMMALLDDAGVPVTKTYNANKGKPVQINTGRTTVSVRDSGDDGGVIDMRTALVNSSNTWFAQAVNDAYRDNPDRYTDFLRRLHLDRKVCVGLPEKMGEKEPDFQCRTSGHWDGTSLVKVAFGQGGMELTPIQVITLYNAIANDGCMVAPRLVSEVRRGNEVIRSYPVQVLENTICSRSTLDIIREAMEETALHGTGKKDFGEGKLPFRAALKTGTAENAQGHGYADGYRVASMATYFPADKPQYTILTSIYTRKKPGKEYYGAALSGPVNRDVALFIYNHDDKWLKSLDTSGETHRPSNIKGGNAEQIYNVSNYLDANIAERNARTTWGRTTTDNGCINIESAEGGQGMPDVRGMGLKDAVYLLESLGLKVLAEGKGMVCTQSIEPGAAVERGETVKIVLKTR